MGMTTSPYSVVAAPKFAGMMTPDCTECGHPELERPVWLDGGNGAAAYGSGCAANLLGIPERDARRAAALHEIDQLDEGARRHIIGWWKVCGTTRLTAAEIRRSLDRMFTADETHIRTLWAIYRDAYGK